MGTIIPFILSKPFYLNFAFLYLEVARREREREREREGADCAEMRESFILYFTLLYFSYRLFFFLFSCRI